MGKKLTWIFLVLVLVLCVKPMRVKAADEGYSFYVNEDGVSVTICDYIGNDANIEIPSKLDGKDVTGIGGYAFADCNSLYSVVIPETVKNIEAYAFANCKNLKEIKVSKDNKKYDSRENCNAIIETKTDKLISGCKRTKIPNSVRSIETGAFQGCVGLTSIYIPEKVSNIRDGVFAECSNLSVIKISPKNKKYDSRNNCNAIIETKTNILIAGCKKTIIPNGVIEIGYAAFAYCRSLTDLKIPSSVKK